MASSSSSKEKFFERVINPYLREVMKHPQTIYMHEGVLHIRDVQGPKKTGTMEAKLEAVEEEIFKCQGMVDHGLSVNHLMIMDFTHDQKVDGTSFKDIIFTLNEQINFLQGQIFDIQNQIFKYESRFKGMSLGAGCRTLETRASSYNGEPLSWKP
ncbi:40S ribosomal protein S5-1 [Hordeum vulgare]|nr:40S ribosomal protein S5-1 [Hordeum vulgare]